MPTPEPQIDLDDSIAYDEEVEDILDKLRLRCKYVKLNVGGSLYTTTVTTLTKQDNMLRAMFSGRMELQTDEEGMLYIEPHPLK